MENIIEEIDFYDHYDYYDNIFDSVTNRFRLPKRYLRDDQNPFEHWSTDEFRKRYRFCQDSVLYIVSLLREPLYKSDKRGLPIPPEIAVLLTLRFYATASFQVVCSDLFTVSQGTASNIIAKISELLAKLIQKYIKFPEGPEKQNNRTRFMDLGRLDPWPGLPGVDGAIDCTHIRLISTPGCSHHEAFRNRKSYFSINVQAVVGSNMEFLDIVARWAGSLHDSRIFQLSSVYMKYMQGIYDGRLVGDSAYPTLSFLLTPIGPPPLDPPSLRYNKVHTKTRNVIERTFGIWKKRFPCLSRGLGNKLTTASNIIVACAVLHNLSLVLNDILPWDNSELLDEIEEQNIQEIQLDHDTSGYTVRETIIETLFTERSQGTA